MPRRTSAGHPKGRSGAEDPPWRLLGRSNFGLAFASPSRVDGGRPAWRHGVCNSHFKQARFEQFLDETLPLADNGVRSRRGSRSADEGDTKKNANPNFLHT